MKQGLENHPVHGFSLKLSQKGLLLVTVLLAFELVFLSALFFLLKEAERAELEAVHARIVMEKANGLIKLYYDGGTALAAYTVTRAPSFSKKFDKMVTEKIPKQLQELRYALREDKTALEWIDPLEKSLTEVQDELAIFKEKIVRDEDYDEKDLRRRLLPVLTELMGKLRGLIEAEEEVANRKGPDSARQTRTLMEGFIAVGVMVNLVAAVMLVLFFTRGITRKIERLTDNSVRLARGKPLNPVLPGTDEIALLDKVFHDMADALAEASQKERQVLDMVMASEKRTRAMIESMPVGLVTIDENGIIESVNPRTREMFGYSDDELVGKHFVVLFPEAVQDDSAGFMKETFHKAFNRVSEMKAKRKDGETFPVELSLNEYTPEDKSRFLANLLEVSERHEVERLKREFVAMVSHDLRTPLTSIQASMTLLGAGAFGTLSKEANEVVNIAENQITRLRNLVNDLLDVAKIEAGKMDMHFAAVSVDYIFKESTEAVAAFADDASVKLVCQPTEVSAFVDAERIVQVLVNLLSNAIKYSPKDSTVTMFATAAGEWVTISVKDSGPGIPKEYADSIFERFEQVKEDPKKKGGTGLGLAISKTIVEQHSGIIGVNSNPGEGSTFWIKVRQAVVEEPSGDTIEAPAEAETIPS